MKPRQYVLFIFVMLIILGSSPALADDRDIRQMTEQQLLKLYLQGDDRRSREAGRQLGKMRSLAGLEAMLKRRDGDRLSSFGIISKMKDQEKLVRIQNIVAPYLADPQLQRPLLRVLSGVKVSDADLYETLYAMFRKPSFEKDTVRHLVINANVPGAEQRILPLLEEVGDDIAPMVFRSMAARKNHDVFPHMKDYLQRHHWKKHEVVWSALVTFDTDDAREFMISVMEGYKVDAPSDDHFQAVSALLKKIHRGHKKIRLDIRRLVAAIPYKDNAEVAAAYAAYAKDQFLAEAWPDMEQYLLGNKEVAKDAFHAMLQTADGNQYDRLLSVLDRAEHAGVIDPQLREQWKQQVEYERKMDIASAKWDKKNKAPKDTRDKRKQLDQKYFPGDRSRRINDPRQAGDYLDAVARLYPDYPKGGRDAGELARELVTGYLFLGNHYRFELNNPRKAMSVYKRLLRFNDKNDLDYGFFALLMLADTAQFDLDDRKAARKWYKKALRALPGSMLQEYLSLQAWVEASVRHQLHYLKTGERRAIQFSQTQLAGARDALMLSSAMLWRKSLVPSGSGMRYRKETPVLHTQLNFHRELRRERDETPQQFLAHLDSIDPSGFWQASYFAIIDAALADEQSSGRKTASNRFPALHLQARELFVSRTPVAITRLDKSRYATPEKTFATYKTALKDNDMDLALTCLSGGAREKIARFLNALPREDKADLGERLTLGDQTVAFDRYREYTVMIDGSGGGGTVMFQFAGDRWLINDM